MSQVNNPWEHRRWRDGICRPALGGNAAQFWFMALVFGGVAAGIALKAPEMLHFSLLARRNGLNKGKFCYTVLQEVVNEPKSYIGSE